VIYEKHRINTESFVTYRYHNTLSAYTSAEVTTRALTSYGSCLQYDRGSLIESGAYVFELLSVASAVSLHGDYIDVDEQ